MSLVRLRPEAPRCRNSGAVCGRSSSGRARPCQGRGSEFEPRRPLQKEIPHPTGWGISFWKCAAAPENSLPRPARSASNQEVRQGSCEWRQPFVGCREASSSLVARSKTPPYRVVFFRVRLGAHRRVSRLTAADAADSRDTSSKAPRFIRRRRRFGAFLVARSKKERHPTGCLSFLGNESGEARNELQLRAPRRGVEAGSNSPGDCCVRERRAEPRNRRGIEEYVKERIYIDGCTHFLPCGGWEYRQQNLWVFFLEMCRSAGVYARCAGCQTADGVVN